MEANTFARLASHQLLSFLIFLTLLSFPNNKAVLACNPTPTIPSYSHNTTHPSYQTINTQTYKTFVLTSCNSTTYPSICYHSLFPFASQIKAQPLQLCNISLSLALKATAKTTSAITGLLREGNVTETAAAALRDCLDNAKDSVGELKQSLDEMAHLSEVDREFQMSSIKTYVSAAITDDQTCWDGLDEQSNVDGAVRNKIRNSLLSAQRMTSNALYFINNLTY